MPIVKRFAFIVLALFGFGALGVAASGYNDSGFIIAAAQADDDDGARAKRRGYIPNAQPRQGYRGQGAYRGRSYRNHDDDDDDGARNRRKSRGKQSRNDDDD
ncbi:MAG: hypothetical protein H7X92_09435 [Chitinophagales bacterium]|nr:hypothetical protein [Hyphomicrobiales bacterium]